MIPSIVKIQCNLNAGHLVGHGGARSQVCNRVRENFVAILDSSIDFRIIPHNRNIDRLQKCIISFWHFLH
jgi:hypothetical protein